MSWQECSAPPGSWPKRSRPGWSPRWCTDPEPARQGQYTTDGLHSRPDCQGETSCWAEEPAQPKGAAMHGEADGLEEQLEQQLEQQHEQQQQQQEKEQEQAESSRKNGSRSGIGGRRRRTICGGGSGGAERAGGAGWAGTGARAGGGGGAGGARGAGGAGAGGRKGRGQGQKGRFTLMTKPVPFAHRSACLPGTNGSGSFWKHSSLSSLSAGQSRKEYPPPATTRARPAQRRDVMESWNRGMVEW